jgi:hypothetical protein
MSFSVASYAKVGRLLTYETRENKEMNKRSLIVGCVLLSVLGFSSVSYSDNHDVLERYGKELHEHHVRTVHNYNEVLKLLKTTKGSEFTILISIEYISSLLLWSYDFIEVFNKTYKDMCSKKFLFTKRFTYIHKQITTNLRFINSMYDGFVNFGSVLERLDKQSNISLSLLKTRWLLERLDKQKNITRSSLETLDKVIDLIKEMERKQCQDMSK